MPESDQTDPTFRHYFVDEAGDPSLFNQHGNVNSLVLLHGHDWSGNATRGWSEIPRDHANCEKY